jgi:hypothetical protein
MWVCINACGCPYRGCIKRSNQPLFEAGWFSFFLHLKGAESLCNQPSCIVINQVMALLQELLLRPFNPLDILFYLLASREDSKRKDLEKIKVIKFLAFCYQNTVVSIFITIL